MLASGTNSMFQNPSFSSGAARRSAVSVSPLILLGATGWLGVLLLLGWAIPARGVVLWSDLGATLAHETGPGSDILGGALKRDDASSDTLYFKFHVAPLSDFTTEEYFAAFELYAGDTERLGVGNASRAWAYSAFFSPPANGESQDLAYVDLHSAKPEASAPGSASSYEFPRRGTERTIIFKVQYVPGGDDLITVWLDPDLGPGANEVYQPEALTTRFNADASFDEIRLRHGGAGGGWMVSDMAIATSFGDFVDTSSAKPAGTAPGAGPGGLPFSFQSWQRESGMPRGPLRALAQTADGYIWLGSDEGVARFDGVRFVDLNLGGNAPAAQVSALLGGAEGELWIGTAGKGLLRCSDGQTARLTVGLGLPSDSITALAQDSQRRIWVGTANGLALWQNGALQKGAVMTALTETPITAVYADSAGGVWVGAAGAGVYHLHEGKWELLRAASVDTLLQ